MTVFTRTTMVAATFFFFCATHGYSTDYKSMTNEELSAVRGNLYNATQDERDAFHKEWTSRFDNMSAAEKEKYANSAPGRGLGLKDGSGTGRRGGASQGLGNSNGNNGQAGNGPAGGNGRGGNGPGGGKGGGRGRK